MSRTVRRKSGKQPGWLIKRRISGYTLEPYFSEEYLKRELCRFHTDRQYRSGPSKWFRHHEQGRFKMSIKQELSKFWKDPEYEVQIRSKYAHDYWD